MVATALAGTMTPAESRRVAVKVGVLRSPTGSRMTVTTAMPFSLDERGLNHRRLRHADRRERSLFARDLGERPVPEGHGRETEPVQVRATFRQGQAAKHPRDVLQ